MSSLGLKYHSQFVLLGQRNYVHATSLFNELFVALEEWSLGDPESISAAYHVLFKGQAEYVMTDCATMVDNCVARFVINRANDVFAISVIPNRTDIVDRIPYDEDLLVGLADVNLEQKKASCYFVSEKMMFNSIVALTKKLHLSLMSSEGYTQWFVSGYKLDWANIQKEGCCERTKLTISLKSLLNGAHSKSTICVNEKSVGNISFARKEKAE